MGAYNSDYNKIAQRRLDSGKQIKPQSHFWFSNTGTVDSGYIQYEDPDHLFDYVEKTGTIEIGNGNLHQYQSVGKGEYITIETSGNNTWLMHKYIKNHEIIERGDNNEVHRLLLDSGPSYEKTRKLWTYIGKRSPKGDRYLLCSRWDTTMNYYGIAMVNLEDWSTPSIAVDNDNKLIYEFLYLGPDIDSFGDQQNGTLYKTDTYPNNIRKVLINSVFTGGAESRLFCESDKFNFSTIQCLRPIQNSEYSRVYLEVDWYNTPSWVDTTYDRGYNVYNEENDTYLYEDHESNVYNSTTTNISIGLGAISTRITQWQNGDKVPHYIAYGKNGNADITELLENNAIISSHERDFCPVVAQSIKSINETTERLKFIFTRRDNLNIGYVELDIDTITGTATHVSSIWRDNWSPPYSVHECLQAFKPALNSIGLFTLADHGLNDQLQHNIKKSNPHPEIDPFVAAQNIRDRVSARKEKR